MEIIGSTLCEACHGTGTLARGEQCDVCGGTGLVQVLESGKIIPFKERRRWLRYRLDIPLKVLAGTGESFVDVTGHGTEINEGGLTVNAKMKLEVGDNVEVELVPPASGTPIRLRGAIRHGSGSHYGMEFVGIGNEAEQRLATLRQSIRELANPGLCKDVMPRGACEVCGAGFLDVSVGHRCSCGCQAIVCDRCDVKHWSLRFQQPSK
jgi:hypothetical protein